MKLDELPWEHQEPWGWEYCRLDDSTELARARLPTATLHSGSTKVSVGTIAISRNNASYVKIGPMEAECLAIEYLKGATPEVTP